MSTLDEAKTNYAHGKWVVKHNFNGMVHSTHPTAKEALYIMNKLNNDDSVKSTNGGNDLGDTYQPPYKAMSMDAHEAESGYRESVDMHEESDFVPAKEYHVLKKDSNGGSATFISSHKDRNKAYKKRDRLDDQYGSYIHSVKPVYDEKESCKDGGCNESLIDTIFKNDLVESTNSFNKILADKITSKLDEAKIQVAQSMFV